MSPTLAALPQNHYKISYDPLSQKKRKNMYIYREENVHLSEQSQERVTYRTQNGNSEQYTVEDLLLSRQTLILVGPGEPCDISD